MNWNNIRRQWQACEAHDSSVACTTPNTSRHLWQKVHWRDGLETGTSLLLIPLFGLSAWEVASDGLWLAAGFAVFLMVALAIIPWRLRQARKRVPHPDPNRSVREFLIEERIALDAQIEMLRQVSRWYYGPIAVGVIGFFGGVQGLTPVTLVYSLVVLALCGAIEALNRNAVRKHFQPKLEQINTQLHELAEE